MEKCLIAAIGANNEIGVKGSLPWHISEDLKYFKRTTSGCPVIMGRKTYDSLPFKPLKDRLNIVLSRSAEVGPGVVTVSSLEQAFKVAQPCEKCFVIGGASVYQAAMAEVDKLFITRVDAKVPEADAYFPEIISDIWKVESKSEWFTDIESGYKYCFEVYTRLNG